MDNFVISALNSTYRLSLLVDAIGVSKLTAEQIDSYISDKSNLLDVIDKYQNGTITLTKDDLEVISHLLDSKSIGDFSNNSKFKIDTSFAISFGDGVNATLQIFIWFGVITCLPVNPIAYSLCA